MSSLQWPCFNCSSSSLNTTLTTALDISLNIVPTIVPVISFTIVLNNVLNSVPAFISIIDLHGHAMSDYRGVLQADLDTAVSLCGF